VNQMEISAFRRETTRLIRGAIGTRWREYAPKERRPRLGRAAVEKMHLLRSRGATLRCIARRFRCSPGTVYNHTRSRS
jgi:hypothetical protein